MANLDIAKFIDIQKKRLGKCLDPTMTCEKKAIRAHSVQNATALDLIAEDNHVYELRMEINGGEPECKFRLIGRNHASTFTGLCSEHDAKLFRPIDTQPLSLEDKEQLFLLAYRSVTRELHVTMEGAMRVQSGYLDLITAGKVPADAPSEPGSEAVQHMLKAWAVWRYRSTYFDFLFETRNFKEIRHLKFKIENKPPRIAASSFFSADLKPWGKPFAAVIVNIIPTGSAETSVIFSYAKDHAPRVSK